MPCRELCLTDSKTEPSSTSRPPAPEWTNTNRSLNLQKERDVKESNSAPTCGVLCAHRAHAEKCVSKRLNLTLLALVPTNTYKIMSKYLGEYPRKNCRLCLEKEIGCASLYSTHCLLKWPHLIYYLLSVSLMSIQDNLKENHSLLLTEFICSFNNN